MTSTSYRRLALLLWYNVSKTLWWSQALVAVTCIVSRFAFARHFRCIPSTKWRTSSSQEDCSPLFAHSIRQPFRLATAFRLCCGRVAGSNGAHYGANPADHSAMTRALVEQSVRVPHCEEHHGESSQSPNQRHRSRPRLRSPDASLDRSSSTAGTPASTAHGLWDHSTDHQMSQASTSDPLECPTSSLSAPEAVLTTGSRNAPCTTI